MTPEAVLDILAATFPYFVGFAIGYVLGYGRGRRSAHAPGR